MSCLLPWLPGMFPPGLQADMNVSLTAIALLWNAADQLAKLTAHSSGGAGGKAVLQAPDSAPGAEAAAEALSAQHLEALLRQLFSALQVRQLCILIQLHPCSMISRGGSGGAERAAPGGAPAAAVFCAAGTSALSSHSRYSMHVAQILYSMSCSCLRQLFSALQVSQLWFHIQAQPAA